MRPSLPLAALSVLLVAVGCGGDGPTGPTTPSVYDIAAGGPSSWGLVGQNSPSYVVGVDHRTTHSGHGALAIAGIDSSPTLFRGIGQYILADQYRGKRIRYSGWVRQQNIHGTDVGLWMRVDGDFQTLAFDNFSTRPLVGTSDWHQVEIRLDVPSDAVGIAFGVLMSGSGELLADDLAIDVIPATGTTTDLLTGPATTTFDAKTFYATSVGPRTVGNMDFESTP